MTSQNFLIQFRAQFPWVSQRPVVGLGPIFYGFLTITPPNYGGTTVQNVTITCPEHVHTLNHGKFHSIAVIKRKASTIQNFMCGLIITKRYHVQIFEAKLPH